MNQWQTNKKVHKYYYKEHTELWHRTINGKNYLNEINLFTNGELLYHNYLMRGVKIFFILFSLTSPISLDPLKHQINEKL